MRWVWPPYYKTERVMSYKSCKGYTLYIAKCDTCDYEESISSITMRCTRAKLSVSDGDTCPEEGCKGTIVETEKEVSEADHKEGYLDYHADDGWKEDR